MFGNFTIVLLYDYYCCIMQIHSSNELLFYFNVSVLLYYSAKFQRQILLSDRNHDAQQELLLWREILNAGLLCLTEHFYHYLSKMCEYSLNYHPETPQNTLEEWPRAHYWHY